MCAEMKLLDAAKRCDLDALKSLTRMASPEAINAALLAAVREGAELKIVSHLISAGGDPAAPDEGDDTALRVAARTFRLDVVSAMVAASGAAALGKDHTGLLQALLSAIYKDQPEVVELLTGCHAVQAAHNELVASGWPYASARDLSTHLILNASLSPLESVCKHMHASGVLGGSHACCLFLPCSWKCLDCHEGGYYVHAIRSCCIIASERVANSFQRNLCFCAVALQQ
jgi:hypothetical protein